LHPPVPSNDPSFLEDLFRLRTRLNRLLDACDGWLSDPDTPDKYDIGLRAEEVVVLYKDTDGRRRRAPLSSLLQMLNDGGMQVAASPRMADPRSLILRTAAELRQTATACSTLMRDMLEVRGLMQLRGDLLAALEEEDEPTRERVAAAFARVLTACEDAG
jgi:hypothetical protein